jgi:hypothetical protein
MSGMENNVHNLEAWKNRQGADRISHAEEFNQAITDLARVMCLTALESETQQYGPAITHLLAARRALREAFGK